MKKMIFIFLIYSYTEVLFSQKHDYNWLFGYDYQPANPGIEGSLLDFNYQPVVVTANTINMVLQFSSAEISDEDGNLLFYTNGCWIADRTHNMMQNGDGINPGEVHDMRCDEDDMGTYTAGNQSCLILPKPGATDIYYLFHKHIIYEYEPQFDVVTDALLYTTINMSYNNGMGKVVQKNHIIETGFLTYGQMTAVKHANGQDWWIMNSQDTTNIYSIFLLTSNGLSGPFEQAIGLSSTLASSGAGQANFSPDGTKYVRYTPQDDIFLFDFDRATGLLSNFQFIPIEEEVEYAGGAVFSPNSRYLYIPSGLFIYQYDTEATDVAASKTVVAEWNGVSSPFPTHFWNAQLGPDCRIYVYCPSCNVIQVIHYPDEPGLACQVEQQAIQLPYPMFRSMPHFPNYRLGPAGEEGLPCQPVVSVQEQRQALAPVVYPNPVQSDELIVEMSSPAIQTGTAQLYSAQGVSVRRWAYSALAGRFTLDVSGLPPGVYGLEVHPGLPVVRVVIVR
jgi:hypothetical protein